MGRAQRQNPTLSVAHAGSYEDGAYKVQPMRIEQWYNLNLDSWGSATCGLGRNIFLSGTKEETQNIRRRRQRRGWQS
jgi:hypothetical protein